MIKVRRPFYPRHGTQILAVAVLLLPLIAWGTHRAIRSNSNDVRDWLPRAYPETQQYRRFCEHFGPQDFIIASWPGCTLDDRRLDEFARSLSERAAAAGNGALLGRVLTGRSLLGQLCDAPVGLDRSTAIARL